MLRISFDVRVILVAAKLRFGLLIQITSGKKGFDDTSKCQLHVRYRDWRQVLLVLDLGASEEETALNSFTFRFYHMPFVLLPPQLRRDQPPQRSSISRFAAISPS